MCIPVSAKQLEKAFPNELGGCLKGFLDLNHEQSLADIVFGYLDRELLQSQVMNIFASLYIGGNYLSYVYRLSLTQLLILVTGTDR